MNVVLGSVCMVAFLWQAPTTIDRILATVDGDLITLSDVRAARVLKLVPDDSSDRQIVEILVERRLVLTEMQRFQPAEPSADALAARRAEWQHRVGGADPAALLRSAGVAAGFVDKWLADDLRRDAYLQHRFSALDAGRRAEAIRLWIDGLRARAAVVLRLQRF